MSGVGKSIIMTVVRVVNILEPTNQVHCASTVRHSRVTTVRASCAGGVGTSLIVIIRYVQCVIVINSPN